METTCVTDKPRRRAILPLTAPVGLALSVWIFDIWRCVNERQLSDVSPRISSGNASELAAKILTSHRALVFVGCPPSTHAVRARKYFLDTTSQLANDARSDIEFFLIEDETADDAKGWAATFKNRELTLFGCLGYGWVFWLEYGQVRELDPYAGGTNRSSREIVERTRVVWP
jgi:hypothetical protein